MVDNEVCAVTGYFVNMLLAWSDLESITSIISSLVIVAIVITNFVISLYTKSKDGFTPEELEELQEEQNEAIKLLTKEEKK